MKKGSFIISLLTLVCFSQVKADPQTKKIMGKLLGDYMALLSYTYSDQDVSSKKVSRHLKQLDQNFKLSKHNRMLNASNFSPLAYAMRESLSEINQHYHSTLDNYAKYRLKRLTSLCISCHTQLPKDRFPKVSNKYKKHIQNINLNTEQKSRLAFLFRDYKKALEYQMQSFNSSPSKTSLARVLKTYLLNLNDDKSALLFLEQVSNNKKMPKRVRQIAIDWSEELASLNLSRRVAMNKQDWIRGLISKYLVPRRQILQDRVSTKSVMISYKMQRILYNYLVIHPDSILSAELMYWLGVLETKERNIDLYTLGEMYFEQCIVKYPESIIAHQCYDAYHEAIYEGFTGSSGTHISKEFKKKLHDYKALIFKE